MSEQITCNDPTASLSKFCNVVSRQSRYDHRTKSAKMAILKLYKKPAFTATKTAEILQKLQQQNSNVVDLATELCYYVELRCDLKGSEREILKWILQSPFASECLAENAHLKPTSSELLIEVSEIDGGTTDSPEIE